MRGQKYRKAVSKKNHFNQSPKTGFEKKTQATTEQKANNEKPEKCTASPSWEWLLGNVRPYTPFSLDTTFGNHFIWQQIKDYEKST